MIFKAIRETECQGATYYDLTICGCVRIATHRATIKRFFGISRFSSPTVTLSRDEIEDGSLRLPIVAPVTVVTSQLAVRWKLLK